jgi:hypothetical protein
VIGHELAEAWRPGRSPDSTLRKQKQQTRDNRPGNELAFRLVRLDVRGELRDLVLDVLERSSDA